MRNRQYRLGFRNHLDAPTNRSDVSHGCPYSVRLGKVLTVGSTVLERERLGRRRVDHSARITGVGDWDSEAGVQLSRLNGLVSTLVGAEAQWGTTIAEANAALQSCESAGILFQVANDGHPQPREVRIPAMRMAQEIASRWSRFALIRA